MANIVGNILAGTPLVTGAIFRAPKGTALPTDATTALNAAFKHVGYAGEDGLTEAAERSTEKVKAWGGDTVKVLQTDFSLTYSFTLLESISVEALKAAYGDANVTETLSTTVADKWDVKVNGDVLPHNAYVFEIKDGDARVRICVPDGQVTELGEVTYTDGGVISYALTLEAFRDSTLGANAVKYMTDGTVDTP